MLEYDLAGELVCEDRHSSAVTSSFQNSTGSVCFCSNVHRINTVLRTEVFCKTTFVLKHHRPNSRQQWQYLQGSNQILLYGHLPSGSWVQGTFTQTLGYNHFHYQRLSGHSHIIFRLLGQDELNFQALSWPKKQLVCPAKNDSVMHISFSFFLLCIGHN